MMHKLIWTHYSHTYSLHWFVQIVEINVWLQEFAITGIHVWLQAFTITWIHVWLQEFMCYYKNSHMVTRICMWLQEFVYDCWNFLLQDLICILVWLQDSHVVTRIHMWLHEFTFAERSNLTLDIGLDSLQKLSHIDFEFHHCTLLDIISLLNISYVIIRRID